MNRIGLKEFHEDDLHQAAVDVYNFVVGNGSAPIAFPPLWDVVPGFRAWIMDHPTFRYHEIDGLMRLIRIKAMALEKQWYLVLIPEPCMVLQVVMYV
jgi:hypothetical protein